MSPKRQAIIDAALGLFCTQGFHATGIDVILKNAGVAKMTLYHYFPSKERLIHEALQDLDGRLFQSYREALMATAPTAPGRLAHILQPLRQQSAEREFPGCPFIKAASEFPDLMDPIHAQTITYKQRFLDLFHDLAREAGYADAEALARSLQLLFEGVMTLMPVRQDPRDMEAAELALRTCLQHWPRTP